MDGTDWTYVLVEPGVANDLGLPTMVGEQLLGQPPSKRGLSVEAWVGRNRAILILDTAANTFASGMAIDEWGRADGTFTRTKYAGQRLAVRIGQWARDCGYLVLAPLIVSTGGWRWTELVFDEVDPEVTNLSTKFDASRIQFKLENHYRRAHGRELLPEADVFHPPSR
jgi:hypothetical protein